MTKSDKTRQNELSTKQLNAIDIIIQGKNDSEVGEAVGVTRQTVCEWRNSNWEFIAQLNARRQDVWGAQEDRLRAMVAQAVDILAEDLNTVNDEIRRAAAVHVLKCVGLYGKTLEPVGPTDAETVSVESYFG